VDALAINGTTLYAGGYFTEIGAQARDRVAALETTTGAATAWNPQADQSVTALATSGATIYAGGFSSSIGGQPRRILAALDAVTGAATAFDPSPDGSVHALVVSGPREYAGGTFANIGGRSRRHLAALDATTGSASDWDPNASDYVAALAVTGSTVYAGGGFSTIGGQARNRLAALDATSGAASSWNPDADFGVAALAVSGSSLYAGGAFQRIGGQPRQHIAALDPTTAEALAWDPNANDEVFALAVSGATVYAGGAFTSVRDFPASGIAAIGDVSTPTQLSLVSARAWPDRVRLTWFVHDARGVNATVLRRSEPDDWAAVGWVSAGGNGLLEFEDTHVEPGARYAYALRIVSGGREVTLATAWVSVPVELTFGLTGLIPNPAAGRIVVAFSLPDAAPARLALLDVAGREQSAREVGFLEAGNHLIELAEGNRIAPGVYWLRLTRADRALTASATIVQ